jgi:hypothetical protein
MIKGLRMPGWCFKAGPAESFLRPFCALCWSAEWPTSNSALIISAPHGHHSDGGCVDRIKAKHSSLASQP